jgi:hypothetical protein
MQCHAATAAAATPVTTTPPAAAGSPPAAADDDEVMYSLDFLLEQWIEQELAAAGDGAAAAATPEAPEAAAPAAVLADAWDGRITGFELGPADTTATPAAAAASASCFATPGAPKLAWQQQQQQAAATAYEVAAAALGAELMSSIAAASDVPANFCSSRQPTGYFVAARNNLASYGGTLGGTIFYGNGGDAAVHAAAAPTSGYGMPMIAAAQLHSTAAAPSALARKLAALCAEFYTVNQELQDLQQQQQLLAYNAAVRAAASSQQAVTGLPAMPGSMLLAGAAAGLQPGPAGHYQSMMLAAPVAVPASSASMPLAAAGALGYGVRPYAAGAAAWQPVQDRVNRSSSTMYGHRMV